MERTRKRENRSRWEEAVEVATVEVATVEVATVEVATVEVATGEVATGEVATVEVATEGQLAGGTSLGFCLRYCSTESVTMIFQPRFL